MTFASPLPLSTDFTGRNLTHQLLNTLGRAIVKGEYDERVFPTEAELARLYRVSRTVTREAVKMLTAKGLVSARPKQGTLVQPPRSWNLLDRDVLQWMLARTFSLDLLRQFNELRVAVEPEAAALAAKFATLDQKWQLRRRLVDLTAAARSTDGYREAEIAFHFSLLAASGNPFYAQFQQLVETALRYAHRFIGMMPEWNADLSHHAEVCNAIERGDVEEARLAMRALVVDLMRLLDTRLGDTR